ncbi:hypothetical protein Cfla_3253 [Cellulomonas flavigena DSM 20109]|uniref:Uncharacterized protein n=1 Tax=Cellulomonas flavigena (strain ATCC 482 / DSM 20109 / BCRC 11376 / JCM 18109 / NBRC 3775 / NCIMB 8073 / NRS 134) TaxID=446466 RepID=D5UBX5_CELFN|nr:hypothetical protein [Cellulomonas flavigena]ADG76134.1 hypothetical protein Cfla_3253 [Cellulomonas flavigena DSM 20109]
MHVGLADERRDDADTGLAPAMRERRVAVLEEDVWGDLGEGLADGAG